MEAEDQVETKLCSICGNQVEAARFRMHEMGCARQNYKCSTCGMCVPKADKESHEEEEHVMVTCEYCGFSDMKCRFTKHEEICEKKPIKCKLCDMMIAADQINEHIQICGSKTKKCEKCGEYVKVLEMDMHKNEGFCDAIYESKQEKEAKEVQRDLEKFQQKRQQEIIENKSKPLPKPVQQNLHEEVKLDPRQVPRKPPVQVNNESSLANMPAEKESEQQLDDYDQMIFNQFMTDDNEDEMLARQMQDQMHGGGQNMGNQNMGFGQQEIRKADSEQYGQLIGGDEDYSPMVQPNHPHGLGMQRQPGMMHYPQQPQIPIAQNQYQDQLHEDENEGFDFDGDQNLMNQFDQQQNNQPMQPGLEHQSSEAEIQKAIAESLQQAQSENVDLTSHQDEELARALEMSKNFK